MLSVAQAVALLQTGGCRVTIMYPGQQGQCLEQPGQRMKWLVDEVGVQLEPHGS